MVRRALTAPGLCVAVLMAGVAGCGIGDSSPPSASTQAPVARPVEPLEPVQLAPVELPAGLTPLPTAAQVQEAVPPGRVDPFAPVALGVSASAGDSVITLQGVMLVGQQAEALVSTVFGTGSVCVGPSGLCAADQTPLLPEEWAILAIDLEKGCLTYAVEGKPQPQVCMDGSKA